MRMHDSLEVDLWRSNRSGSSAAVIFSARLHAISSRHLSHGRSPTLSTPQEDDHAAGETGLGRFYASDDRLPIAEAQQDAQGSPTPRPLRKTHRI